VLPSVFTRRLRDFTQRLSEVSWLRPVFSRRQSVLSQQRKEDSELLAVFSPLLSVFTQRISEHRGGWSPPVEGSKVL